MNNTSDEQQIRNLITRWATAVHSGDLDTVLAHHADDILMFDVPEPQNGVRGIGEYRESWPGFFGWQAQGAVFDIVELEVTAGTDVAFAVALLRCGTPDELSRFPDRRLRLTVGLRRQDGGWVVSHEHHSFAVASGDPDAEIRAVHHDWFEATAARDLDRIVSHIADDVVSYEHETPLQYDGLDAVRSSCARGLAAAGDAVGWTVPDLTVVSDGDLAVSWGLDRMTAGPTDGDTGESFGRGTRVFRRATTGWELVHQHVSFPMDPETGASRTDLRPSVE